MTKIYLDDLSDRKATAKEFAGWIRGHWSIETPLHWVLDVVFKEEPAQAKAGFIAENMAFLGDCR